MPTPAFTREQALDTIARVEAKLREGCRPLNMPGPARSAVIAAAQEAAREGLVRSAETFKSRVQTAKDTYGLEPDWDLFRPLQYLHRQPGEPVIPSQDHIAEPEPEGDPLHMAVIGDAHDSPHLPNKERFFWLGRYIAERGIERVVSVGDWLTMDCFSSHTDRATFEGRAKPTFEQDINSFHESQQAFQRGLDGHKPKLHITLGNHENRAYKYDNFHPDGVSHGHLLEQAFLQWGWRTSPYGEYRFFGGVAVTHIPFNAIGKPLAQGQRVNKALCDVIHGDDHRATQLTDFKSGPFRSPTVYSAGTALPPGFIEGFANRGGGTWRAGICEAVIWGSHVRSWKFEEMVLLRKRYGQRMAA